MTLSSGTIDGDATDDDDSLGLLGSDADGGFGSSQARFELLRQLLACTVLDGMYEGETRCANLQNELIGVVDFSAGSLDGSSGEGDGLTLAAAAAAPAAPGPLHFNPGLVWWQPLEDFVRRVKVMPSPGQVRPVVLWVWVSWGWR